VLFLLSLMIGSRAKSIRENCLTGVQFSFPSLFRSIPLLLSTLLPSIASPRSRDTATTTTTPLSSYYLRSRLHSAATITFIYKRNHQSLQRLPSLHYFAHPPPFRILSSLSSLQTVLLPSPLSLSTFVMSLENVRLNKECRRYKV
jgi:hypothetical protein